MDEIFAQSKKFFALPLKEKIRLLRNENIRDILLFLMNYLIPRTKDKQEITKKDIILELKYPRMAQNHTNHYMDQTNGLHMIFFSDGEKKWKNTINRHCIQGHWVERQ